MADDHENVSSLSCSISQQKTNGVCPEISKSTFLYKSEGNLFWKGDFECLKEFIEGEIKLSGKWLSPGGEAKKFVNQNFSLKWQGPKSKRLSILEDDEDKYLETCLEGFARTANIKFNDKPKTSIVEHVLAHVVVPEGESKVSTCDNCKDMKPEIDRIMSMFTKLQLKQDEECQRAAESEAKVESLVSEHISKMATEIESLKATVAELEVENSAIKNVLEMKQSEWIKVDSKKSPSIEIKTVNIPSETPVHNSFSTLNVEEPEEDEAYTSFPALDDDEKNMDSSHKTNVSHPKQKSKSGKVSTWKNTEQNIGAKQRNDLNKTIVIGDSMIKHIDSKKIERAAGSKSVSHSYSGARVNQINEKFKEHRNQEQYDCIILHVGTNDLVHQEAEQVAADMEKLLEEVKTHTTKVAVSSVIKRYDGRVSSNKINCYNGLVKTLCSKHNVHFINNNNIDKSFLNGSNLHLNRKGDSALGNAFCTYIKSNRVKTPSKVSVPLSENNQGFHHVYGHRNREWTLYLEYVSQRLLSK